MKKQNRQYLKLLFLYKKFTNPEVLVLLLLFSINIFFRFYNLENRTIFGWDQVDNAWAAKDILIDHKILLVGMVAKQNTGFYIGPLYYYFVAFFYAIFHLDPIAVGWIVGVASVITFLGLFFFTNKLFNSKVALLTVFFYVFSWSFIDYDKIQWPINFVPLTSLIIFYALYKFLTGEHKYVLFLAAALGFSLHLNFTSVFFLIIVLLSLPFFPKTKQSFLYVLYSIPVFLVFLIPNVISELSKKGSASHKMFEYIDMYYHGFHIRRMMQLANDAFLETGKVLLLPFLQIFKFFLFPIFCILQLKNNFTRERIILCYLTGLWFLVPWITFTVYKGEITDYYFSLTRPIALFIFSYILWRIFEYKSIFPKVIVILFLLTYCYNSTVNYFKPFYHPLSYHREKVLQVIKSGGKVEFSQGVPESYLYYFYDLKYREKK